MKYLLNTLLIALLISSNNNRVFAQPDPGYWQQHVDYTMDIDMDVKSEIFKPGMIFMTPNISPLVKSLNYLRIMPLILLLVIF